MVDRSNPPKTDSKRAGEKSRQPRHALSRIMKVIGTAHNLSGDRIGFATRLRKKGSRTLICPIALTGRHNTAGLERWILDNGLDAVLSELKVSEFGMALRGLAGDNKNTVIEQCGLHKLIEGDQTYFAVVWDRQIHYFGERPKHDVLLVGDALNPVPKAGSVDSWLAAFVELAAKNPRLLVAICACLSAAMRRPLNEPSFTLAYVAPTSTAKSTFQMICSSLTGPPNVVQWNATGIGLQDWLADRPDQPACVEDLHKADKFEDIAQIIMSTGNGAGRIRSRRSKDGGQATAIQATLIVSSEKSLASMASSGSAAGVLARCFEIHAGKYGMPDDLCGFDDGGALANHMKRSALENFGAPWPKWLTSLSESWPKVQKWHRDGLPEVRRAIVNHAGDPELDELTGRLVDRLAFAAFSGRVATKLGFWSVKREAIVAAFGLLVREHVDRSPPGRNALADAAIEAVRSYIETHRSGFPPLTSVNDPNAKSGIAGYFTEDRDHGKLFLFIPGTFRSLFERFGDDLYKVLKDSGYLVTQPQRHNLFEKKVPTGVKGKRRAMFFIAVREEIRYARKGK